jgi:CubicO group peptidase (beta-lactamase class C family)
MPAVPPVPGSVLIRRGGDTIAEAVSDRCTARTRFQIASVSKQFTAAAVLLLAERGVLTLEDPIGRRLGGCPSSWQDITLHHLLTHTSGLGHWPDHPMIDPAERLEPAQLLEIFHDVPPLFRPGAGWHYSSPAYVLLAHVVQQAAGTPYRRFLAEEIFDPLGLAGTFAGAPGDRPDIARGHDRDGGPVLSWELDVTGMGAGDIWSTAADLLTWIDGLRAGRVLGDRYRSAMLSEQAPTGGTADARGYGYGWYVGSTGGHAWFHHSGENPGFRAFAACVPALDCRIVVLSNSESTDAAALSPLFRLALG